MGRTDEPLSTIHLSDTSTCSGELEGCKAHGAHHYRVLEKAFVRKSRSWNHFKKSLPPLMRTSSLSRMMSFPKAAELQGHTIIN